MTQRLVLQLGKFRVAEVGFRRMTVELADGYKMTVQPLPDIVDVRAGDLLTLYTEVLTHAPTYSPPK